MSALLELPPFSLRNKPQFLLEMNDLTCYHLNGCEEYRRVWPEWRVATEIEQIPFIHVSLFKKHIFKTNSTTKKAGRVLKSSATTSGISSQIILDQRSSELQSRSSVSVLSDFLGGQKRPLLVLDSGLSLREAGGVSARMAAAMSMRPLASDMSFALRDANDSASIKWSEVQRIIEGGEEILVYGFTYMLWLAWLQNVMPSEIRDRLKTKRICFVHSGGWKKLEAGKVTQEEFNGRLLSTCGGGSQVIDFYGLVEQVGMVYPMCEYGFRHVPLWGDAIVRDVLTLRSLTDEVGMLQLMNTISWGAPYHSVLTEDMARVVSGSCKCGRLGKKFQLLGRIPQSEVRGCANV